MIKNLKNKWSGMSLEVKASLAYTVCSILMKCLSFITMPLFTRLLTTEQYGQYSVYLSWSGILVIFTTLNLAYGSFSTAMVRFEKDRWGYVSALQGLCCVLTLVFLAIYLPFTGMWNALFELPTPLVLLLVTEILAQFAVSCFYGVQRFEFKYKSVVGLTLLSAILSPVTAFVLVMLSREKGYARIIGYALANIIIGIVLFIINSSKGKGKLFKKEYWKYALTFNIPLIPYYLSQVVFNQSDRIMISHLVGTDKAGIYSVAYTLGTILNFVLNAINNSYVPWLYTRIKENRGHENRSISNGIALLMAFLLLGVMAVAPEIILIMAGPEYAQAIWVVPSVAMSILLLFYSQLFINIEFYYEEKTMLVWGSIGAAILNIVLNWVLIPVFGFVAAGYTTLASYIAFAVSNYVTMRIIAKRKQVECNYFDMRALCLIFVIFAALGFLAMALYNLPVIRYAIIAAVLLTLLVLRKKVTEFVKSVLVRK